jgi:hypothetical protein
MDAQEQVVLEREIVRVWQETTWPLDRIAHIFRRTDRSVAYILKKHGLALPKRGRRAVKSRKYPVEQPPAGRLKDG